MCIRCTIAYILDTSGGTKHRSTVLPTSVMLNFDTPMNIWATLLVL